MKYIGKVFEKNLTCLHDRRYREAENGGNTPQHDKGQKGQTKSQHHAKQRKNSTVSPLRSERDKARVSTTFSFKIAFEILKSYSTMTREG